MVIPSWENPLSLKGRGRMYNYSKMLYSLVSRQVGLDVAITIAVFFLLPGVRG
jgi:hypothetical protein